MTAREKTIEHLHSLQESVQDWERYKRSYSLKQIKGDRDIQNMVLHAMLVSIQACIDASNHLISHFGLTKPNSYREAFEILASHEYLDEHVAHELQELAGFRNLVVHVYWRLDLERVHKILRTKHEVVVEFANTVRELIE